MKSRKNFYKIIIFALFIICISLFCVAKSIKSDVSQDINTFVKFLDESKLTRIEIYYYAWGDPAMHTTEEDMIKGRYEYKVIASLPSISLTNRLKQVFSEIKFPKIEDRSYDVRLLYIFYAENKEIMRLSFCSNFPAVYINGQSCRNHAMLMSSLIPLLPKDAHEAIYSSMLDLWSQIK